MVTRPFESAGDLWVTEAIHCPTDPLCLPGEEGAVFFIASDRDRDRVLDDRDNCPDVPNGPATVPADNQVDTDTDGFGDACDVCPMDAFPVNSILVCNCDIDEDGCNNESLIPGRCATTASGGIYDQIPDAPNDVTRGGAVCATDADCAGFRCARGRCLVPLDSDGDGLIDHCDPDDDNDSVLDDGAGDGFATYSPCPTGALVLPDGAPATGPPLPPPGRCDDNCRTIPNWDTRNATGALLPDAVQRDTDRDGVGNACEAIDDPLCASGSPICLFGPRFFFDRFFSGPGLMPMPFCPGGPACRGLYLVTPECLDESCRVDVQTATLPSSITAAVSIGRVGEGWADWSFVDLPDRDGDGFSEWLVGIPGATTCRNEACVSGSGILRVLSPRTGQVLEEIDLGLGGARFGASLARVGNRVFVGAPRANDALGARTGAVFVLSLEDLHHSVGALYGRDRGDRFGRAIVRVPDADGDGIAEGLLISAPGADPSGLRDAGAVYAVTLDGTEVARYEGPVPRAHFGRTVSTILATAQTPGLVFLGAPGAEGHRGLVAIYEVGGQLRGYVPGQSAGDRLGQSITSAADFDGDGIAEVAISAPGANRRAGVVFVVDGTGALVDRLEGARRDRLGMFLASPGDLDSDKAPDLVLAVPNARWPGEPRRGAWIVLSGAGGAPTPPGDPLPPPNDLTEPP